MCRAHRRGFLPPVQFDLTWMSAIVTGLAGVTLLRRGERPRTLDGDTIVIPQKESGRYNFIFGGLIFGLGWGIIGLCPGPIFSLVGLGSNGALEALTGPLHDTWLYGCVKNRLPH